MLCDRVTWTFINSFADWFSALGTIAAVITALYLARRDKLIRLKIVAGLRTIAHQGQTLSEGVKGISITITNIGSRTVRITNLHWRIGRLRKTFLHQITDVNPYTSPLPLKLADGEEAHYFLPVDAWEETNADKPFYIFILGNFQVFPPDHCALWYLLRLEKALSQR